ncbi:hypothetical protein CC86DRAFT_399461 [Ophiobolus disseminans]|uniref:Mitochondrial chaperone BCS1-like ATPase lid domain-containing protein n=1 Tax=Ophiobolus disseminans TaxID=1469910 RepID=A0A6A7AHU3_9PLEO|nr:hypothetical protein CC86DRAFT_399461 [Ophiobolus disseminans]
MTANNPEALDHALTRPGRIDFQIEFALALKEQIRDIYIRMFALEKLYNTDDMDCLSHDDIDLTSNQQFHKLDDIAKLFAQHLPSSTFSPAEVQGFLLQHKDSPQNAIRRVCD